MNQALRILAEAAESTQNVILLRSKQRAARVFLELCAEGVRARLVGEWLSLVEHLVRDQGVGGSNPLSPTNFPQSHH